MKKVLVLNNYPLEDVWEEVKRKDKPDHHLYGINYFNQRKFEIEMYDAALKRFYAANKRSPQSLDELVSTGLIKKVTQDMVTKQPPTYNPQDFEHGCRVEYVLSNGATIAAYCK